MIYFIAHCLFVLVLYTVFKWKLEQLKDEITDEVKKIKFKDKANFNQHLRESFKQSSNEHSGNKHRPRAPEPPITGAAAMMPDTSPSYSDSSSSSYSGSSSSGSSSSCD